MGMGFGTVRRSMRCAKLRPGMEKERKYARNRHEHSPFGQLVGINPPRDPSPWPELMRVAQRARVDLKSSYLLYAAQAA